MESERSGTSLRSLTPVPSRPKIEIESLRSVASFATALDSPGLPRTPKSASSQLDTPTGLEGILSRHLTFGLSSSEDEEVTPSPDLTRRGIHIPTRTSSRKRSRQRVRESSRDYASSIPTTPESREISSADSILSYETSASSIHTLPPLQNKGHLEEIHRLEPLAEDDPGSFDLLSPVIRVEGSGYSLEKRSEQLFSRGHLESIFSDASLLHQFTSFLTTHRPQSVPLLIYYLDASKAIRAINYANAIAEALEPIATFEFTEHPPRPTVNVTLEEKAKKAFDALVKDDLPVYITHVFVQVVSLSIQRRITGTLAPHLREASEGLAEVFCLTDPSRKDNPVVFASEEFHRMTQYGVGYVIGRNCRFLQGPRTNPYSVHRLASAIRQGKEHSEVFLNHRRDGSPFMNLLTVTPLLDNRGTIRYYLGAQVDVSGLVKDCTDLEGFRRMLETRDAVSDVIEQDHKDEFQELSEMFNLGELDIIKKYGGRMHREYLDDDDDTGIYHRPRLLLKDPSNESLKPYPPVEKTNGKLERIYQHYLLVRPYPSLRILFTSPSLRVPGILQSPFLNRIGGSHRVREELTAALAEGRGVTAKIRWLNGRSDDEGRSRWIHCTPLLGANGAVGVWMIVLIDEKGSLPTRRFRPAPPVARDIGSRNVSRSVSRGRHPYVDLDSLPVSPATSASRRRPISPSATASQKSINSFTIEQY